MAPDRLWPSGIVAVAHDVVKVKLGNDVPQSGDVHLIRIETRRQLRRQQRRLFNLLDLVRLAELVDLGDFWFLRT